MHMTPPMPTMPVPITPVESFFSPLSILPQAPSSMPVPPLMSSALSAGRLYRSQAFVRELGSTNPEWNLAHSYPFQSLAFAVFSQAMNTITPLHAMYTVVCETTSRLQALENENFSLANQVSHLSSVNERLLSELQICQQLYLTEGFQRCQYMCGKIFPDLDFNQVPYTEEELTDRLLSGWLPAVPSSAGPTASPVV